MPTASIEGVQPKHYRLHRGPSSDLNRSQNFIFRLLYICEGRIISPVIFHDILPWTSQSPSGTSDCQLHFIHILVEKTIRQFTVVFCITNLIRTVSIILTAQFIIQSRCAFTECHFSSLKYVMQYGCLHLIFFHVSRIR